MTKRYIVELEDAEDIENLRPHCQKVGSPSAIGDIVVVESDLSLYELEEIEGVVCAEEECFDHPNEDYAYTQEDFRTWFLPFLAQSDTLRSKRDGAGVDIYIMDTGMRLTHEEFEGRAQTIYSFDGRDYDPDDSMSPAHGTQVGSCAAGATLGPAKAAKLYNVRYSFSNAYGTKALDTVLKHHREKDPNRVSILNMSFGSPSRLYVSMMRRLTDEGIICVGAAGNAARRGPEYPAASDDVIAVGSHDEFHFPSNFTNFGPELDIYAPGDMGVMAGIEADDAYDQAISGTSFSAPLVSGMLALITQGSHIRTRESALKAKKRLLNLAARNRLALRGDYERDPNRVPSFRFKDRPIG